MAHTDRYKKILTDDASCYGCFFHRPEGLNAGCTHTLYKQAVQLLGINDVPDNIFRKIGCVDKDDNYILKFSLKITLANL